MKIDQNIVAVVTGAASGLGAAVAMELHRRGAKIAILDRNGAEGRALAQDIGGPYADTDVSDSRSVTDALTSVRPELGQEGVCVNCAGIAVAHTTLHKVRPMTRRFLRKSSLSI